VLRPGRTPAAGAAEATGRVLLDPEATPPALRTIPSSKKHWGDDGALPEVADPHLYAVSTVTVVATNLSTHARGIRTQTIEYDTN
jgi:hypothetical protein